MPVAPIIRHRTCQRWPAALRLPAALLLTAVGLSLAGRSEAMPPLADDVRRSMQEDAELADVAFVDAQTGWAVGDRGVIWHTGDGGQTWQLQPSGVDCRLESVCFVDAKTGWAVGGYTHPYNHASSGVLLATRDGGKTWSRDRGMVLPALHKVKFVSPTEGWLLGDASSLFPAGVFFTENGGRSWSPVAGQASQGGWLCGDFVDQQGGALAGRSGQLAVTRTRKLEPTKTADLGWRHLRAVRLTGTLGGWLVGDGDLVMTTIDRGLSWQLPASEPPTNPIASFDWHAVATVDNQCWIAGTPGTRVLHSPDGGASWQALATGHNAPLRALHFVDARHGWAVGALGVILHTADGGQTWTRQRAGGTRGAILALYANEGDLPLEILARLAGNDGYLAAAAILTRGDLEPGPPSRYSADRRAHAALVAVGGSSAEQAWAFPIRHHGLQLSAAQHADGWNRAHDGRGVDRLEAYLVRQIRTWRPEIVLTHAASPRGDNPLGHMINQLVLRAVDRAASPTHYSEQFIEMGLEPWQTQKVFGSTQAGELGSLNVATSQIAPRLAGSLGDVADAARGLVEDEYRTAEPTVGFRLFVDHLPQKSGSQDFLAGINLHPGGDARRVLVDGPLLSIDQMRQTIERRRNVKALINRASGQPWESGGLLGQVDELTRGLPPHDAGNVLFQLAQGCHEAGRWEFAVEIFGRLVSQSPDHPLAETAARWLVRYWASGEVAWQMQRQRRTELTQVDYAAASTPAAAALQANWQQQAVAGGGDSGVVRAGAEMPLERAAPQQTASRLDTTTALARAQRAVELGKVVEQMFPALSHDPGLSFALAVAQRRQGLHKQAERYYHQCVQNRPDGPWRGCAAGELWMDNPQQPAPDKPLGRVVRASAPPRLDGRLDDALWRLAQPLELRSTTGDDAAWPAVALAACDQEFLYLAVMCRKAPQVDYPAAGSPRPRDANLTPHDRVELLLDLDRDYATYYRLVFDHRGWTSESCFGDATWNPTWYVAAQADDDTWTVEAAIPLEELTGEAPTNRSVWAVGVQRIVPGVGLQSWTRPAALDILPEGFGYWVFD